MMVDDTLISATYLKNEFDLSRAEVKGKELERLRQNFYIEAKMRGSDDISIGGLNINQSGRRDSAFLARKKEKQTLDDLILLSMLEDRLAALEKGMAEKYGEDFAEQLAAEFLGDDTYKRIMSIQDKEERRRAIAGAINEGIENGTIDPAEIYQNPDFKDWLDLHAELSQRQYAAQIKVAANETIEMSQESAAASGLDETLEQGLDVLFATKPPGG